MLQREFDKKALKEMTFSKLNIWVHKKDMFPLSLQEPAKQKDAIFLLDWRSLMVRRKVAKYL